MFSLRENNLSKKPIVIFPKILLTVDMVVVLGVMYYFK